MFQEIQLHELNSDVKAQAKRLRPNDEIIFAYMDEGTLIIEFRNSEDPYTYRNNVLARWR